VNSAPILTIITPVFNGEKYLTETINSVINAKIDVLFEYLVLDDGSKDSTSTILKSFEDKIIIYSHQNIGEAETVNRGIKNARGEFILVVSADDPLINGELINSAILIFKSNLSVVAIYPDWRTIDAFGHTLNSIILPEYSDEILIGHSECLPGPGTLFRKDAALKIGGRNAKWRLVSDYDFWLRLSRVGKFQRLPGVHAQWRQNPNSASIAQRGKLMAEERINVIEDFINNNVLPRKLIRKARGNAYYQAARLTFFDSTINGRQLLFEAFKHRRGWPEEARLHEIIYLLLAPLSSYLVYKFPRIIRRITSG